MAISDISITSVDLTNTFDQWRSKSNQLITVLNENDDDNPTTALLSANSIGGLSINTITSNIVTGSNVTGSKLIFTGGTVDFTGASVTDLGTAAKFALVEDSEATVTGASPDSKIERCQINESEINLNGKNLNANGSSTINLQGATVSDLGTVSQVTVNGGTINDANVNITDDSGTRIITISAVGPHILTGATFGNGTFNNAVSVGGLTHSANISVNSASAIVANAGAIFGSDVGVANVAIGNFPEYTHGVGPISPTSSKGRLHVRTDFADGTTTATAVEAAADDVVVEGNTAVGMTFIANNASNSAIAFGDPDDADIGGILYDNATDSLHIVTGAANTVVFGNEYGGYMQVAGGDTLGTQTGKLHVNVGSSDGTAGIFLDSNDVDQIGVSINGLQTTANVFEINADKFTTGHVISIHRGLGIGDSDAANGSLIHLTDNNSSTNARAIIDVDQDTTGATGSIGLRIKTDGGSGISVIQNADKVGINVESSYAHSSALGVFKSNSTSSTGSTLYVEGQSSTGGTKVVEFANSSGGFFAGRANGVTWCSRLEVDTFLTPDNTAVNMFAVRDTSGTIVNPGT